MARPRVDIKKRFFEKITKTKTCWIWTGCGNTYGRIGGGGGDGKLLSCHRFSYELHKGKIPKGLYVLHKCDNMKCVNPEHLFVGTQKENCMDCVAKKRHCFGERNGFSKITEKDVLQIRQLLIDGFSQRSVAKVFNLSQTNINDIHLRKRWKHI